ncbi:MAG: type II toxin-antitoxin system RelE/ParE family toxin [Acidobacteriota bacterium]
MKLQFTPSGRIRFLRAAAYIHRDNPRAALKFRNRAEQILRRLTKYPESGRPIPEFPDLPFREVNVLNRGPWCSEPAGRAMTASKAVACRYLRWPDQSLLRRFVFGSPGGLRRISGQPDRADILETAACQ